MPRREPRPTLRLKEYNVVQCPRCKFIQGMRKSGSCKSCGNRLDAPKLKILGSTNRVTEVPELVRRFKASLAD